jgi:hypothetical protein
MKKLFSLMSKIMYLFIAVLTLGLLVAQAAATPITLNLSTGVASWTFEKAITLRSPTNPLRSSCQEMPTGG